MSYVFPYCRISYVLYTTKRWGQTPTITYVIEDIDHNTITAGNEIVTLASDLSDITIQIEDGVSTNTQVVAALMKSDVTAQSLYARDLVDALIDIGEESTVNYAVAATPMANGSSVPPPLVPAISVMDVRLLDPENPTFGQLWYNVTDGVVRFFDGTSIIEIAVV